MTYGRCRHSGAHRNYSKIRGDASQMTWGNKSFSTRGLYIFGSSDTRSVKFTLDCTTATLLHASLKLGHVTLPRIMIPQFGYECLERLDCVRSSAGTIASSHTLSTSHDSDCPGQPTYGMAATELISKAGMKLVDVIEAAIVWNIRTHLNLQKK